MAPVIEVDPESGAVRMDEETFEALLASAQHPNADPDKTADPGAVALQTALDTIQDAVVVLDVVVAGETVLQHRIWVTPERTAAVLAIRPGLCQVLVLPPSHLAAGLVRLTGLGPRRTGERQARPWPPDEVGRLVEAAADRRRTALHEAGATVAWRLGVTWEGARRELTAVDGPDGIFLADEAAAVLRPVSPSAIYRIFTTALPPGAVTESD